MGKAPGFSGGPPVTPGHYRGEAGRSECNRGRGEASRRPESQGQTVQRRKEPRARSPVVPTGGGSLADSLIPAQRDPFHTADSRTVENRFLLF